MQPHSRAQSYASSAHDEAQEWRATEEYRGDEQGAERSAYQRVIVRPDLTGVVRLSSALRK